MNTDKLFDVVLRGSTMKNSKNKITKSILIALIGVVILACSVLFVHNQLVTNNQLNNNHEKLELIESKIEKSKSDEEEITAVYDEMYQSKVDSLAFQLKYITDIDLNDTYANEMREVYNIDYLVIQDGDSVVAKAGEQISEDEEPRSYTASIDGKRTISVQINNETLNTNLEQNASLKAVLDNVNVGQNGFVLAFHTEKKTVIFSPTEEEIGQDASTYGVDVSSLSDGEDTKLTYNGVEYLASCKQIDNGMIVTVVPYSEMTANDIHTVVIALVVYGIFMSIIILYTFFLKEEVKNKIEDAEDAKKQLHKKLGRIVIIGALLSFGVSFYMQTLFTLSEQSITNNKRGTELLSALKENDETLERQKEEYNEMYSQKLDELAYIIAHVDQTKLTRSFMTELKEALDVNSVMYFDLNGNVIAANTDNWSYSISKDEEDQSYEYWDILNGEKTKIIQDVQKNVNGNLRQYMAEAVQDDSYHTIGMVTMSATPEQLEKATINTDTETVLAGVSTGNNGFAFSITKPDDDGNSTFVYFPKENLIGKDVKKYGMNSSQFVADYNDFITVDGTTYYCASGVYDDMVTYIAVPFSGLNITALPISCITAVLMVLFMILVWYVSEHEKVLETTSDDAKKENEQIDVVMSDGRVAKARSINFRWSHDDISWESKTAGQKTTQILNMILTVLAFVVMVMVLFKDQFFADDSLFHFILSCQWQKGINIFSITYCLLIVICVIEISLIFRKFIMWIAHSLNAKGETICRLIDNFVKFATTICLFYFALSTFGVDTSTLVTSAGILTLIVGLGAQSLVSDILAGLFIVFEGEFQVGDIVTIDGYRGTVIEIGVRTTKVKEGAGNVKIFSNSSVKNVLNMTKDYSFVACDMSIEYNEDLHYVEKVLQEEFPNIKKKLPAIVDGPFYRGVSELADSAVIIKVIAKCTESDRVQLDRDLRRQLKLVFDKHNINIPFPQVVVNEPTEVVHEVTKKQDKQAENFVQKQNEEFKDTGIKEE